MPKQLNSLLITYTQQSLVTFDFNEKVIEVTTSNFIMSHYVASRHEVK